MKDYIQALREGKGYDWICAHGHELSKTELVDIIKELEYAIYYENIFDKRQQDFYDCAADNLAETYEED